jgi:hypothetical protein
MNLLRIGLMSLFTCASIAQVSIAKDQSLKGKPPNPGSAPATIAVVNGLRPLADRISRQSATSSQRPVLLPAQLVAIDMEPSGGIIQPNNPVQKDNLLTVDLLGATLAPGPGDKLELKMPYVGIESISLVKIGNTKLRLEILGENTLPTLAWIPPTSGSALLAITPCPNGFISMAPASTHGEGSARLMYDLDAKGCPHNIRVNQSGGSQAFDRWAIQSLQQRQYRFNGTRKDVRIRLTYEAEGSTFQQMQQKRRLNPPPPEQQPGKQPDVESNRSK